jgi:hypothetical protein
LRFNRAACHKRALGNGSTAPLSNFSNRWGEWPAPHPSHPTPMTKSPRTHRRMGRSQSRSGHSGEEKNSESPPAFKLPIIQPTTQHHTTELSQLPYKLKHSTIKSPIHTLTSCDILRSLNNVCYMFHMLAKFLFPCWCNMAQEFWSTSKWRRATEFYTL